MFEVPLSSITVRKDRFDRFLTLVLHHPAMCQQSGGRSARVGPRALNCRPTWHLASLPATLDSVGLEDEIAARLEAERQKAQEIAEQMESQARDRAWYSKRPWASPTDELVTEPPREYADLMMAAYRRLSQPPPRMVSETFPSISTPPQHRSGAGAPIDHLAWDLGLLYLDRERNERLARTRIGAWRTFSRYIRKATYFHRDNGSYSYGSYSSGYTSPTWSFTLIDDGRVGKVFGGVDKLTQVIADIVMGGHPQ